MCLSSLSTESSRRSTKKKIKSRKVNKVFQWKNEGESRKINGKWRRTRDESKDVIRGKRDGWRVKKGVR